MKFAEVHIAPNRATSPLPVKLTHPPFSPLSHMLVGGKVVTSNEGVRVKVGVTCRLLPL